MGFNRGVGPRLCAGCRAWFDVRIIKMRKIGRLFYCGLCFRRIRRRRNNFVPRPTA